MNSPPPTGGLSPTKPFASVTCGLASAMTSTLSAGARRCLAEAVGRVVARGGVISHLDVAFVAEGPKIAPYREAIRASVAAVCGISLDRVGGKAAANEG